MRMSSLCGEMWQFLEGWKDGLSPAWPAFTQLRNGAPAIDFTEHARRIAFAKGSDGF